MDTMTKIPGVPGSDEAKPGMAFFVGTGRGFVGFVSKWGISDWQYWAMVMPICIYIGVVSSMAASNR